MRLLLLLSLFVPSLTFQAALPSHTRISWTRLYTSERADSSDAIAKAMEISDKFGPESKEARLAWEAVEDIDSSDSSAAFRTQEKKDSDRKAERKAYKNEVNALDVLLHGDVKEKLEQIRALTADIEKLRAANPKLGMSNKMKRAIASATEATKISGANSREARLAWEAVEELSAAESHNHLLGDLDETILSRAREACNVFNEMSHLVEIEKKLVDRYGTTDFGAGGMYNLKKGKENEDESTLWP